MKETTVLPCGATVTQTQSSTLFRSKGGLVSFQIEAGEGALTAKSFGDDCYSVAPSVKLNFYGQNIRTLISLLEATV